MERLRQISIVADDAGSHPAIDRGIRLAVENSAITGADYMLEEENACSAALSLKKEFPNINIGLHVSLPGVDDFSITAIAYWSRWQPNKLIQRALINSTENQIKRFQDMFGRQPPHLSVQSSLHLDHRENPFSWFTDFMSCDEYADIVVRGIHTKPIRHIRYRELLLGKNPLTPNQFERLLENTGVSSNMPLELVVHPAHRGENDSPFRAFYTLSLREQDLESLVTIIKSGVISRAGYQLVSPDKLIR